MIKRTAIFLAFVLFASGVFAEEAKERVVTRAEVIEKLSTADFLKRKIGDLLNWSVGYDITKINRTNLAPTISFIKAMPVKVPPDNRTVVLITAKVSDPRGLDNIRGVRADLSSINKLPNTMLVDNGLWGDEKANDSVYTLQTNVPFEVTDGSKDIPVAVANKAGWVALGRTNLDVETNPVVSDLRADPDTVAADGKTIVTLTARVENPGRQEDIREVRVDLRSIDMGENVRMVDDGSGGDRKAGDIVFTASVTVKPGTLRGVKKLPVRAINTSGGEGSGEITLTVQ